MKILLIQTAFIGDVVLATALVDKLHQLHPDAIIDFVVKEGNQHILNNQPYIRKVLVFDKQHRVSSLWKLLRNIRSNHYDQVINMHRFLSSGLLTILSGAKYTVGFEKNPLSFLYTKRVAHQIGNGVSEVARNMSLLGITDSRDVVRPKLYPSSIDSGKVIPASKYICISPTSVWFTKQYPISGWIELVKNIYKDYIVYILGAPNDTVVCQQICDAVQSDRVINLSGLLNILESAALMKHATMNYVNDSAPMHIASAMNAPVTAIYCSTIPAFGFIPMSDVSHIIETEEKLSCRPCGLHGHQACPEGHFKCGNIQLSQLLEVLK